MKSYMELCLNIDGEMNIYLRVETVWDDITKTWRAFLKTPKTQKLIHAEGKNSFALQNDWNRKMKELFDKEDALSEELFSMFQPLSYWDEMSY